MRDAIEVANRRAPEHLQIVAEGAERIASGVRHAGAIFLGDDTPEPVGDYLAGPSHVLPTGGTARYASPLGVYDFVKRTSVIRYTPSALAADADAIIALAEAEGLFGHAEAVRIAARRRAGRRLPAGPTGDCALATTAARCPAWAVSPSRPPSWSWRPSAGGCSGSLALLADAGHMLTDVGALALSLLTAWIAQRPADHTKTYGYLRWEILAALVNGAALFGIAAWVVVEAIQRIQDPQPIRTGLFLAVAAAGLVVNLVSLGVLHGSPRREASTPAARTSTCWATRWARSARSPPPRSSPSPAGPWPTRSSPSLLSLLILVGAWRLLRESTDILLESRAPARLDGGGAAPDAGGAGRDGGARPPRLDGDQRHGGDERPCRGARPGVASGCAGRIRAEMSPTGDRARHHPARGRARVREAATTPGHVGRRRRH